MQISKIDSIHLSSMLELPLLSIACTMRKLKPNLGAKKLWKSYNCKKIRASRKKKSRIAMKQSKTLSFWWKIKRKSSTSRLQTRKTRTSWKRTNKNTSYSLSLETLGKDSNLQISRENLSLLSGQMSLQLEILSISIHSLSIGPFLLPISSINLRKITRLKFRSSS